MYGDARIALWCCIFLPFAWDLNVGGCSIIPGKISCSRAYAEIHTLKWCREGGRAVAGCLGFARGTRCPLHLRYQQQTRHRAPAAVLPITSCLQSPSFTLEELPAVTKLRQVLFGVPCGARLCPWGVPSVGRVCTGLVSLKRGSQVWLSMAWLGRTCLHPALITTSSSSCL